MAVFTHVSADELKELLELYDVGDYRSHTEVLHGTENSTFRLKTSHGQFALTLFEGRTPDEDVPLILAFIDHLTGQRSEVAPLFKDRAGRTHGQIQGKLAAIIGWVDGKPSTQSYAIEAFRAGRALAKLHEAGRSFTSFRPNPLDPTAWQQLLGRCRKVNAEHPLLDRLDFALKATAKAWPRNLPCGAIHGDFFPDNVLFGPDCVPRVIDFAFACVDSLAYDLAIAHSAWGFSLEGAPLNQSMTALLNGYQCVRPLEPDEVEAFPILCRGAALRFTLTRLHDQLFHDPSSVVQPKDPAAYLTRLEWYESQAALQLEHA